MGNLVVRSIYTDNKKEQGGPTRPTALRRFRPSLCRWSPPRGWWFEGSCQDLPTGQPPRGGQQQTLTNMSVGAEMVCVQKNLPLSKAATLSCLEPQAMSSNHSPEMRIARASTFFSSSIFCGYKPSSEKQSMMEDSRWSVESVTKQVVNPSLTCNIVQWNCH